MAILQSVLIQQTSKLFGRTVGDWYVQHRERQPRADIFSILLNIARVFSNRQNYKPEQIHRVIKLRDDLKRTESESSDYRILQLFSLENCYIALESKREDLDGKTRIALRDAVEKELDKGLGAFKANCKATFSGKWIDLYLEMETEQEASQMETIEPALSELAERIIAVSASGAILVDALGGSDADAIQMTMELYNGLLRNNRNFAVLPAEDKARIMVVATIQFIEDEIGLRISPNKRNPDPAIMQRLTTKQMSQYGIDSVLNIADICISSVEHP